MHCINHLMDKPTSKMIVIAVYFPPIVSRTSYERYLWWCFVWNVNAAIDSYSYSSSLLRLSIFEKASSRIHLQARMKLCEWLSLERKSIFLISHGAYLLYRKHQIVYEQLHYRKECLTPILKLNSTAVCKIVSVPFNGNIKYRECKSRLRRMDDSDNGYLRKTHFFLSRRLRVLIHFVDLVVMYSDFLTKPPSHVCP